MLQIKYIKKEGSRCTSPIIDILVEGKELQARLDTGADITVLPKSVLKKPLRLGNPITVRQPTSIQRVWTYITTLVLMDTEFTLEVLTSEVTTLGLIGLDILKYFRVEFLYDTFSIEVLEENKHIDLRGRH
jgi:predicted aspartyl protease